MLTSSFEVLLPVLWILVGKQPVRACQIELQPYKCLCLRHHQSPVDLCLSSPVRIHDWAGHDADYPSGHSVSIPFEIFFLSDALTHILLVLYLAGYELDYSDFRYPGSRIHTG
jgi:hypothetical protein